jgi:hypothetical protein
MSEVVIRIKDSYYEGNEVVILENVSRFVLGWPYKGLCKINERL